jgi:hypothetical protein
MKRVLSLLILLPATILALILPGRALAASQTLNLTQDTYANQAYPDKANGSVGSVIVSNKYTTRLGYLMFESLSFPAEAIIDSAVLKIYLHEVHYADTAKVNVGPVSENWTESSITWNAKPTIDQSQATEATLPITDTGWREIGVTSIVKKWRDGSLANYGLFIYPFGFLYGAAETEFAFSFKSQESGENIAVIEIEYHLPATPTPTGTPVPASPTPPATPTPDGLAAEGELTPSPNPSPTTATSPEATEEAGEKPGLVLSLTTGQTIIGGLILVALVGALGSFIFYFSQQKSKPKKKEAEKKPESGEEPAKKDEELE